MNAFTIMVDAQFEDPNLGLDAIWRAGGAGTGLPVRVRRRSPEAIIGAALTFSILLKILTPLAGSSDIGLIALSERLTAFIDAIADRAV